jgi:hypothetical protein
LSKLAELADLLPELSELADLLPELSKLTELADLLPELSKLAELADLPGGSKRAKRTESPKRSKSAKRSKRTCYSDLACAGGRNEPTHRRIARGIAVAGTLSRRVGTGFEENHDCT